MAMIGHIRLIGDHHASHFAGAHLAVTDNPAMSNPDIVSKDAAEALVAKGDAEWVTRYRGPLPETLEQQRQRHDGEQADLANRHAREHADLMTRHRGEHNAMSGHVEKAVRTTSDFAAALKTVKGIV